MGRKFLVRTFGCQMNEHDSERIAALLVADGLQPAETLDDADVVVLNTCCIRENADNKLYGNLGHLKSIKQERPELQIVVAGCLAQKDREVIQQRASHVDLVFGTHNVDRVASLLRRATEEGPLMEIVDGGADSFPEALPIRDLPFAAWVTIQVGCDNSCAFCIVPSVRGAEASKPLEQIRGEVEALAANGTVEVTLLGQNVNSYGRDLATKQYRPLFADLLRSVGEIDGIRRVRFTSPHPKDLRSDAIEAMATVSSVCNHLHL
ncbi:MAG TPA: MiaB/RimO family radical SAM methylthiotransferase, partial [Acidimicrobiales bacterium]|nr:MiaB/RimO family radical SAM methylthiotransferase [Acidimicrobiales bacterium]